MDRRRINGFVTVEVCPLAGGAAEVDGAFDRSRAAKENEAARKNATRAVLQTSDRMTARKDGQMDDGEENGEEVGPMLSKMRMGLSSATAKLDWDFDMQTMML